MKKLILLILIIALTGCGTMTGLPSHGGGKRFAYEQALVNISTRESLKQIPVDDLKDKKVKLVISVFGDQGGGNLYDGRINPTNSISGYFNTYHNKTGGLNGDNWSTNSGTNLSMYGFQFPRSYDSQPFYNNGDIQHLNNLVVSYFTRNNVYITPIDSQDKADYIVELLFDVYGTVRNQTDWFVKNQEKLSAITSFELTITPVQNSQGITESKRIGVEAEYIENYNLWVGPIEKNIKVKPFEYNQLLGTLGSPSKLNKEPSIDRTYIKPQSPSTVIVPNSNSNGSPSNNLNYIYRNNLN